MIKQTAALARILFISTDHDSQPQSEELLRNPILRDGDVNRQLPAVRLPDHRREPIPGFGTPFPKSFDLFNARSKWPWNTRPIVATNMFLFLGWGKALEKGVLQDLWPESIQPQLA